MRFRPSASTQPRPGGRYGYFAAILWQRHVIARGLAAVAAVIFAGETRTGVDAAAAIGCDVGAIVKSLVFRRGENTVLVLCSGANTVDAGRLDLARAEAAHARASSGFAIGGVPGIATRLTLLPRP